MKEGFYAMTRTEFLEWLEKWREAGKPKTLTQFVEEKLGRRLSFDEVQSFCRHALNYFAE